MSSHPPVPGFPQQRPESPHPGFVSVTYYPGHTSIRQDSSGATYEAWFHGQDVGLTRDGEVWAKDRHDGSKWRKI
jgi:hypothetical protein